MISNQASVHIVRVEFIFIVGFLVAAMLPDAVSNNTEKTGDNTKNNPKNPSSFLSHEESKLLVGDSLEGVFDRSCSGGGDITVQLSEDVD